MSTTLVRKEDVQRNGTFLMQQISPWAAPL